MTKAEIIQTLLAAIVALPSSLWYCLSCREILRNSDKKELPKRKPMSLLVIGYITSVFCIGCVASVTVQYFYPPGVVLGGPTNPIFRHTSSWFNWLFFISLILMAILLSRNILKNRK